MKKCGHNETREMKQWGQATCAILLLLVSVHPAFSATKPDGTIEITNRKEQFMSTLASMPYTSSGAGPILYVLECSTCPSSQAFERDWKGQLDGVEIRRLLIATNTTTANETAYLARTRDINDFYAFMNHKKVAPKIKACNCPQDNVAIRAFNSVAEPLRKVLVPTMEQNGWRKNASPPQFIWQTDGRVFVSGYHKASVQQILSTLRPGTQPKEVSAPSRTPAHESGSTLTESSPAETTASPTARRSDDHQTTLETAPSAPISKNDSASALSVAGLRLGMSGTEVLEALKAHKSTLIIQDHHIDGDSGMLTRPTWYIRAVAPNHDQDHFVETFHIILSNPNGPKQSVIAFSWESQPRKPMPKTQLRESLRQRYGRESPTTQPNFLVWYFDSDGKSVPPPAASEREYYCIGGGFDSWRNFSMRLINYEHAMQSGDPFTAINPKCGTVMDLMLVPKSDNGELASAFNLHVISNPAYLQALSEASAYFLNKKQESQKQELERAKKNDLPRF